MKEKRPTILITIVTMALIMACATSLGLVYLQGRLQKDDPPIDSGVTAPGVTVVDGIGVMVNVYPDETVKLIPVPGTGDKEPIVPPVQIEPSPTFTPVPPTATPVPSKLLFEDYTVQQGDSLYNIVFKYQWKTSIELLALNNIDADEMIPGDVLSVPYGNPAYCPGNQPYAVREGDTAFSIAHRAGTTADELKRLNNMDDTYTVYVTDIICIPNF